MSLLCLLGFHSYAWDTDDGVLQHGVCRRCRKARVDAV
jgi:hypothetical protein